MAEKSVLLAASISPLTHSAYVRNACIILVTVLSTYNGTYSAGYSRDA